MQVDKEYLRSLSRYIVFCWAILIVLNLLMGVPLVAGQFITNAIVATIIHRILVWKR